VSDLPAAHLSRRTHLFTLRLWLEPVAVDRAEMRGRVQHVLSGEAIYFRTWPELSAFVEAMVAELEARRSESTKENRP
jgi:hypothetical protein